MVLQNEQLGYWSTLWVMLLDIYVVLTGPERRAVRMALWLAAFDQGCASTAIINYAPQVLEAAGVTDYGDATLWSSAITAAKVPLVSTAQLASVLSLSDVVCLPGMYSAYHELESRSRSCCYVQGRMYRMNNNIGLGFTLQSYVSPLEVTLNATTPDCTNLLLMFK